MAKEKAAKAGKEHKKKKDGKELTTTAEAAKLSATGQAPLKPRAGPSSENSTIATQTADKNSKKKDKADKKSKNKAADTSVAEVNGTAEADLDENAILLREIKSLGGTEEDFELLKDIDTDNEDENQDSNTTVDDKKLANDLKSFMATLGDLKSFGIQAVASEDEEEEVASDSDEEDGDDVEEENEEHVLSGEEVESEDEDDADHEDKDDDIEEQVQTVPANAPGKLAPQPDEAAPKAGPSSQVQKSAPVSKSGMLLDPHPRWYDIELPELPELDDEDMPMPSGKDIERMQTRATKLLEDLGESFAGSLTSDTKGKGNPLNTTSTLSISDRAFIKTILTSGTETDKLSALILLSSSSPIHTTAYLNQLLGLTKKKSRDQAVRAIRAIVDWLQGGSAGMSSAGLPDRKLKWFAEQRDLRRVASAQRSGLKKNGKIPGDEHLAFWAFEDWLKKWYFGLLQVIEGLLHDPLPFIRMQMTGFVASLLSGKPEQEQNLLRLLIDKLADSDKSVSSRTSHHILQVIQAHPLMKGIVVREVAALVLKPATVNAASNASHAPSRGGHKGKGPASTPGHSHAAGMRSSDHSRYYGIITLNQIMLSRSEQDKQVANKLLETYFSVFQDLLGTYETNEGETQLLPQSADFKDRKKRRDEKKGKKGKEDEKLAHLSRQDRRKVVRNQQALESESKLMAAVLTGVNRAFPYSELEGNVLHARVDTLFRIIHTGTFNVGIQALMLIFQVSSQQQSVSDRFYRVLYDTLLDHRLAESSKQAMYLNLLFKSMKADTSSKRVAAIVKRLLQILAYHQPPFVCGALYLLGELFNVTPGLRSMFAEIEDNEDDVEVFKDAPDSDNEKDDAQDESMAKDENTTKVLPQPSSSSHRYDGKKRDPQYANAQNTCLWEIAPLLSHYHPSVALHASQLLYGQNITTKPDLELHTLSHFLDRFVYRNPKKSLPGGNNSNINAMKPGGNKGQDTSGLVIMRKGVSVPTISSEIPLNNENFAKKKEDEIPVDQLFFHRYFKQKLLDEEHVREKSSKNKKRKRGGLEDDESDIDSDDDISIGDDNAEAADLIPNQSDMDEGDDDDEEEDSDLDEDEVWKAMQASMPPAEGDADLMEDDDDDDDIADGDESGSDMGSAIADGAAASSGGDEDEDDISAGEFAYSDSEADEDAAMDAILAGDDDDEEAVQEDDDANSDLAEDEDMPSFFPDNDDEMNDVPTFDEDEDDLIGSDEDIVLGDNIKLPAGAIDGGKKGSKNNNNKKRKLKHLPAFASADDWADLIEGHDSE